MRPHLNPSRATKQDTAPRVTGAKEIKMSVTIMQAAKIARRIQRIINSASDPRAKMVEDNIERELGEIGLGYKLMPSAYCDPVDQRTHANLVKWIRANSVPKF